MGRRNPGPRTAGRRFCAVQAFSTGAKTLAQAIVKQNIRPFWAAPRVRRKFAAQRRIAQGGLIPPEHFNHRRVEPPCGRRNPKRKTSAFADVFLFGGGGGSRTPVRKLFHGNFSGRRRLLRRSCSSRSPLPRQAVTPEGQVSFIVHGRRKALPAHVHH